MDLWIRSQDKEVLGQFKNLCVEENMSGDIIILGSDGHIHINDKVTSAFELGIYETKERALEVLDEIQSRICPDVTVKGNNEELDILIKAQMLNYMITVYQMPEE